MHFILTIASPELSAHVYAYVTEELPSFTLIVHNAYTRPCASSRVLWRVRVRPQSTL
jgi:hypothetical protein